MKPELNARLARLEQTPDISRVSSGSPCDLVLRPADTLAMIKTITGIEALVRRGLTVLKAKRLVEGVVENGEVVARVPCVDDIGALARDLRKAGIAVRTITVAPVDVKSVRTSLHLTQEQFALHYGLDIDAVQNWEQGRCDPDRATLAYLRAIAADPQRVAEALEGEVA